MRNRLETRIIFNGDTNTEKSKEVLQYVTRQGKVIAEQTHPQVKWALQHTYGGDVAVAT